MVVAISIKEVGIAHHQGIRHRHTLLKISGIVFIETMVFGPSSFAKEETAEGRTAAVGIHGAVTVVLITYMHNRILESLNDISHYLGSGRTWAIRFGA